MLHLVGKLRKHLVGNVAGALRDEVHAHAFGADELHHLHDFADQGLWHAIEQQVRLVKEEHEARFFRVAHFGQRGEQA